MKILSKFAVFCFVGAASLLVDLTAFNIFLNAGVNRFVCGALGIFFALVFNFFINRNITFSATEHPIIKQAPRYMAVYFTSNLVNLIVRTAMLYVLGKGVIMGNLAIIIGTVASIPISFFGLLLWAFKNKNTKLR